MKFKNKSSCDSSDEAPRTIADAILYAAWGIWAIFKVNELVDAAGTISALSSIILALIIHWTYKDKKDLQNEL